jgi:hypothetical protein
LFFAAVDSGMRALTDCVDAATEVETDPIRYITQGVRAYLAFFDRQPELIELLIIERAEFREREESTYFIHKKRNEEKRVRFLKEAIRKGVIRDLPVESVMSVIADTLYGAIFTNHFSRRHVPFERQAGDIIDIVFNGILTDTARPLRR